MGKKVYPEINKSISHGGLTVQFITHLLHLSFLRETLSVHIN